MEKKLKDFQIATANHIVDIFKSKRQRRVLLSDEVGLGKTIVSKEVIRQVGELDETYGVWDDGIYRVVYICSNANIVKQNTENLGITEVLNIDESRLSMQHLVVAKKAKGMKGEKPQILIPLTPGTSFNLQNSAGNMNERALMYNILSALPDFKDHKLALKNRLNIYNANTVNWNNIIRKYEQEISSLDGEGGDYSKKVRQEVMEDEGYKEASSLLLKAISCPDYATSNKAISLFRLIFCKISMKELSPDLVIMDEFQRFSSLLDTEDNSEEALLTRNFFGQENGPFILLVSATPYKPFTTLEELNEYRIDSQYQDFIKLTDFLFKERADFDFKQVWHDYSMGLCQLSTDSLDILIAKKDVAEDAMYKGMSRTERYRTETKTDLTMTIKEGDVVSYCQMQEIINVCNDVQKGQFGTKAVPMEYVKSSPYLLSFMDKYKLKQAVEKALDGRLLPISSQKQRCLLKVDDIYRYRKIEPCNAKLGKLYDILFGEKGEKHGEQLLWVPASHPYYSIPLHNVFARNHDFSKILVFSAWEMVPRMIACMLSYAVEQKSISLAFPAATYTNQKESDEINERNKLENRKAGTERLRDESLRLTILPSLFLAKAYSPIDYLGQDIRDVRASVRAYIISQKNIKVQHQSYSAQSLLDIITQFDSDSSDEIRLSSEALDILTDMAIGSPGVCFYRLLKDQELAREAATEFCKMFNRRYNAAALDIVYNKKSALTYYQQVIDYCVMGNLQAVLDEFAHMIDEEPVNGNNVNKIQKRIVDSFIGRNYQEIDTTESFAKEKKKWRIRTHYAMPYGKVNMNEKDTNKANDTRLAFNSPFRPFVLTSTSVGQEGLDFHWYCRKIMHWNIPSNPQDIEQREGRIDRYKSLYVRRNVAKLHPDIYEWSRMFDETRNEAEKEGLCELVPYWSLPKDILDKIPDSQQERIESVIPLYPLSADWSKYERMKSVLSLYRLTMGQPRQEELLELFKDLREEDIKRLLINLSPIRRCYDPANCRK